MKRILLLFIIITYFLSIGCIGLSDENIKKAKEKLVPNAYGLPLTKLWNITVDMTGIDNRTAVLDYMWIKIGRDGTVESILLRFYANKAGRNNWYQVEVSPRGEITWYSAKNRHTQLDRHPISILKEVELINFRDLTFGERGLFIQVSAESGSVRFEETYSDIFQLNNGSFTPLKMIQFSTNRAWYTIDFCKSMEYDTEESKFGSTTVSQSVTIPEEDRQCRIAFILQDYSRAETIEYN